MQSDDRAHDAIDPTSSPSSAATTAAFVVALAVGVTVLPAADGHAEDSDDGSSSKKGSSSKVASIDFVEKPDGKPKNTSTKKPKSKSKGKELRHYDLPDHCGRVVVEHKKKRRDLPRLGADYEVDLRGDLATVVVRQSFKNPSNQTLEGVYEFPMYSEAAVYGMTMKVGDTKIKGNIQKKKKAKKKYKKAKKQGKKAALLSQDRPNLFTQRVANIEPGQRVEVTIRYTHPVPKDQGEYELLVPLNLPERYTPANMKNNKLVESDGEEDPGSSQGGTPGSNGFDHVDFSIHLDGSMPVSKVSSSSHKLKVHRYSSKTRWIELGGSGDATHSHFRLNYRLSGDKTRVGVNSYWNDSEDEGYFDVLIEPPSDVSAESVEKREMIYVLDRSGSMNGERFKSAKTFVKRAIEHLRPSDKVRLITFSSSPNSFRSKAVSATPENVEAAQKWLENQSSGGGTEMAKAVKKALKPTSSEDRMRLVTFVTDVKVSNEFEVLKLVRKHVDDARIFTMGVGPDPNSYLLDALARAGRGFSRQFQLDQNMEAFIDDSVRRLQTPVLTDISIDWGDLKAEGVTPSNVPDVFEGGSVRVHGKYSNTGKQTIKVKGTLDGEDVTFKKKVEFADSQDSGESIELAWARQRVADYMHELNTPDKLRQMSLSEEKLKKRITKLGLNHSLTTQWTSFVAVAEDSDTPISSPQSKSDEKEARSPRAKASSGATKSNSATLGASSASSGKAHLSVGNSASSASSAQSKGRTQTGRSGSSSKSAPSPDVDVKSISVSGDLKKSKVRQVLKSQRQKLRRCYARQLAKNNSLSGKAGIQFTVKADGDVKNPTLKTFTVGNKDVRNCVKKLVKMWVFPKPNDGNPAKVAIVVTFTSN